MNLILLPGLNGTSDLFSAFLDELPVTLKPIVIEYPKDQLLSYDQLLVYVKEFIPKNEDYYILGESFSGPLAVLLAYEADSYLKGLIFVSSFIKNPKKCPKFYQKMAEIIPLKKMPLDFLSRFLLGIGGDLKMKQALVSVLKEISDEVFIFRLNEILKVDVTEKFKKINIPCLYLRAKYDYLVPQKSLEHILSYNQKVLVSYVATTHFLLQNKPKFASHEIEKFICNIH